MLGVIGKATFAIVIVVVAASAVPNKANAQMAGDTIKTRQGLMKNNGKNFGVIGGFVKKNKGSAADVAVSARNIASDLSKFPNYFPNGTSQGASAGINRAKPEIWKNWSKFTMGAASVAKLALDLSLAAETGDNAEIGRAMDAMGKGCGGCHQAWRGPKN